MNTKQFKIASENASRFSDSESFISWIVIASDYVSMADWADDENQLPDGDLLEQDALRKIWEEAHKAAEEMQFNEYTVSACTAIALCDNENEARRQSALLVSNITDGGECTERIVFGWSLSDLESEDDFRAMCEDDSAWEVRCDAHRVLPAEAL